MGNMAQATVLYDVADQPVFTIFKEQRIEVPLAQMSPNLVNAVLSVEDQRFYQHRGVDVVRIMGAVLVNLQSGRLAQGGSDDHPAAGPPELPHPRAQLHAARSRKRSSPRSSSGPTPSRRSSSSI